jgi:hypothetical protein
MQLGCTLFCRIRVRTLPWREVGVNYNAIHRFKSILEYICAGKISAGTLLQILNLDFTGAATLMIQQPAKYRSAIKEGAQNQSREPVRLIKAAVTSFPMIA